jgi:hypothetical protein
MAIFNGQTGESCPAETQTCISLATDPGAVGRGIAAFDISEPPDGTLIAAVLGLDRLGRWQPWLRGESAYQLLELPGGLLACNSGKGVAIRAEPSPTAAELARVDDGTVIPADRFVLPVATTDYARPAVGWYHVTGPTPGWVASRETTADYYGSCNVRDIFEDPDQGGVVD